MTIIYSLYFGIFKKARFHLKSNLFILSVFSLFGRKSVAISDLNPLKPL